MSTKVKLKKLYELKIIEANSVIVGNYSILHAKPNDFVSLDCKISAPQQTNYVYWHKNGKPIYFDDTSSYVNNNNNTSSKQHKKFKPENSAESASANRGVTRLVQGDQETSSRGKPQMFETNSVLVIKSATTNDTGNYTCNVS